MKKNVLIVAVAEGQSSGGYISSPICDMEFILIIQ